MQTLMSILKGETTCCRCDTLCIQGKGGRNCNGGRAYLILQGLDALGKGLEEDQLQVALGGSDEGDCVVVPWCPFKMGLALASLYHDCGGVYHQTRSPLPATRCTIDAKLTGSQDSQIRAGKSLWLRRQW